MKKPSRIQVIVLALVVAPVIVIGYGLWKKTSSTGAVDEFAEIDWHKLRLLDYQTGKRPFELEKLNGSRIKIPGFVVPLDDEGEVGGEFLLVPSPQACIHVPPPPPNQMIMVQMTKGETPKRSWGPVWIKGKLLISEVESAFGVVAYKIYGEATEVYKTY
jgi:uncharacterized protein